MSVNLELENRIKALTGAQRDELAQRLGFASPPQSRLRLTAFVVCDDSTSRDTIRRKVANQLPSHMNPTEYIEVTQLPRLPNGKIDNQTLLSIANTSPDLQDEVGVVPPRNPTENALAQIWSEILGIDKIGIHDDFFEIGGDSITSIHLISKARSQGIIIDPKDIADNATIAALASVGRRATKPSGNATSAAGATERVLAEIWQRILQVEAVVPSDDFFKIGGTSLLAIPMLTEIERRFQVLYLVSELRNTPTLRSLASRLDQLMESPRSVAPAPKSHRPFIFMPTATGDTLFYLELKNQNGKFALSDGILRAIKIDLEYTHNTTIEDLSTQFLGEVRKLQPNGPYYLFGNTCSVTVTLELSRQLREQQQQVAFLGVINSIAPRLPITNSVITRRYFREIIARMKNFQIRDLGTKISQTIWLRILGIVNKFRREFVRKTVKQKSFEYLDSIDDYAPQPYPGDLSLFITDDFERDEFRRNAESRWRDFVKGKVNIVRIPGDINGRIFDEDKLPYLCELLPKPTNFEK